MLEDLTHTIMGRGPEGEQHHYGEDGKLIKGKGRVDFEGLKRYEADLRRRAGFDEGTPITDKARAMQEPPKGDRPHDGLAAINLLAKAFGGNPIDA